MTNHGTDADRAAIDAVVATIERTQREEDVEGFVALFTPNAIWTTGAGVRLIGRDAIREFTARALPGAMTHLQGTTYDGIHVLWLRPDVVAVQVRQVYADNDGVPSFDGEGAPTYVMIKEGQQWRIAVGQNTGVMTQE